MEAMVGNGFLSTETNTISYGTAASQNGDLQSVPSLSRMSPPTAADDSGIYVIYADEPGKADENQEVPSVSHECTLDTNSLSPLVLIVPGATPLALVARDDPGTPPASPKCHAGLRPAKLDYSEERAAPQAYPATICTVDEGFEFYQREIIEYKLSRELMYFPKDFLKGQPEITPGMRSLLIDWLAQITRRCHLKQDTLFLATNILDRFLSVTALSSDCLQLLGIVALFIAGKQEENCPLEVSQLIQLSEERFTEEKYSRKQALLLERLVLSSLKFDLHPPTALFFMETLATHRITGCRLDTTMLDCIEARRRLARYTLELILQDYALSRFRPSLQAASVLTGVEEILEDGYLLFRPGPHSMMDLEFQTCLQDIRVILDIVLKNNRSLDDIMDMYAIKP